MVDLVWDVPGPQALVEPRQLIEQVPKLSVIGLNRLHRPWPGKDDERCVRAEAAGFGDELGALVAQDLGVEGIEKQIAQMVLTVACDDEHAGKRPRLAAHLRIELGEHHALPRADRKIQSYFALSDIQT